MDLSTLDYKKIGLAFGAGVGGSLLLGASLNDNARILGVDVPEPIAWGAIIGVSTAVAEFLSALDAVKNNKWTQMLSSYLKPVITGVSAMVFGSTLVGNTDSSDMLREFGLGFVSELIAEYVAHGTYMNGGNPNPNPNPNPTGGKIVPK